MDASEILNWAPYLALVIGFVCGLAAARSFRAVAAWFLAAVLVQVVVWTAFYLIAETRLDGGSDWEQTLGAGFLAALMISVPYTTIGAVVGAGVVGASRLRRPGSPRPVP
jgi:chromate transport protein ChrA